MKILHPVYGQQKVTAPVDELIKKYDLDKLWGDKAKENLKQAYENSKAGIVLGLSGKIGAGKDTIGSLLSMEDEITDLRFISVYSFAAPLKEEINTLLHCYKHGQPLPAQLFNDVSVADMNKIHDILQTALKTDPNVKAHSRNPAIREALQFWGTEVRRKQDPLYWVKKTMHRVLTFASGNVHTIITDVRFENEAQAIADFAGLVIRLDVDTEIRKKRVMARDGLWTGNEHESETALDNYPDFDLVVKVCKETTTAGQVVYDIVKFLQERAKHSIPKNDDFIDEVEPF